MVIFVSVKATRWRHFTHGDGGMTFQLTPFNLRGKNVLQFSAHF